jgi:transcriptional regulator with XRE-family HTH domain
LRAFAGRVRERRDALGLSQGEFAERCGKHRTYISSVERGRRNIALVNVLRLAKALDVDPGLLLGGLTLRDGHQERLHGRPR